MSLAFLKWFAYISMVADHIGMIFFPHILAFRIIGRLALPIFASTFILGFKASSRKTEIIKKLFVWGAIAQVAELSIQPSDPNILFGFALFALSTELAKHPNKLFRYGPLAIFPLFYWIDYGFYLYALLAIFWWYPRKLQDRLLWYGFVTVASGVLYQFNYLQALAFPAVDLAMTGDLRWGPRFNFYFLYAFQWWAIALFSFPLVH
jgi:hypothetical protein